jgi:hypothetical protein
MGRRATAEIVKPKMYALLIGVSHYTDESVPQLNWADKDAEGLSRILKAQKGRLYRDVGVRLRGGHGDPYRGRTLPDRKGGK